MRTPALRSALLAFLACSPALASAQNEAVLDLHDHLLESMERMGGSDPGCPRDVRSSQPEWRVVFLARVGTDAGESTDARTVTPGSRGSERAQADIGLLMSEAALGSLTQSRIEQVIDAAGESLGHDPMEAMAYVAALGARLDQNYGDSHAGRFVTRLEQFGRLVRGESVGQCSDIHYAMLRTYRRLMGGGSQRAYLVNFQTGGDMHHTDLVIEHDGRIYTIDYGTITEVPASRTDPLLQPGRATHSIGYRVFDEAGEHTDRLAMQIDSPLGMFLREVSTGRASFNPFQESTYSAISLGAESSGGSFVRTFYGELPGGDMLVGVAANFQGEVRLPAGFSLEGHVSGALAYAHRQYRLDDQVSELHSEIIYLDTSIGLVSPELTLGPLSVRARTDFALNAGVWFRQFDDGTDEEHDLVEGDGNILNRSQVTATLDTEPLRLEVDFQIEAPLSFATSFPRVTDGSSADGFAESLHVIANRVQGSLDLTVHTGGSVEPSVGGTIMHTGLGEIGEVRAGIASPEVAARAYLRGALDRERTPAFVPGAVPHVGVTLEWCNRSIERQRLQVCMEARLQHSLESEDFSGSLGLDVRY